MLNRSRLTAALLFALVVLAGSSIAYAEGLRKEIKVVFNSINLMVNNKPVSGDNILYNGTTYVPLRKAAELLGKEVKWDNTTNTANIVDSTGNQNFAVNTEPVQMYLNNREIIPENYNLYKVEERKYVPTTIHYEGVAYIPIKMIANLLGYQLEQKDNVVTLKNEEPANTANPLSLQHFNVNKYVDFYFSKRGIEEYKYIYDHHKEIVTDLVAYFGTDVTEPLQIYIFGNDTFFGGFRQQKFIASQSTIETDSIAINADALQGNQDVRYHFSHEYAHALTDAKWGILRLGQVTNGKDQWLGEGIAEYVSKHKVNFSKLNHSAEMKELKYGKETYINTLKELKESRNINLAEINAFSDTQRYSDYFIFESIVYYLHEAYGKDEFFLFMDTLVETDLETAFMKAYGKSEKELVKEWKSYFFEK